MELKQSPLYQLCRNEGCRVVPFAGWEMPIQFSGLLKEHHAVRHEAGLFDISHMGVLRLEGSNPKAVLQKLVPSDLNRIGPGEACYTVLLNKEGGIIDDLIVYDLGANNEKKETLLIVINAACYSNDINWLQQHISPSNIHISDAKKDGVLLALQGPKSQEILENYCKESLGNLPHFGHRQIQLKGIKQADSYPLFIARTGYTGEDGFELLLTGEQGKILWQKLINEGIIPCGLGARDTLRLEAGMHLYGNDLDSTTTPFEAGLGWIVHLEMLEQFIGRDVLEKQAKEGLNQRLVSLKLQGRAIARKGHKAFFQDKLIGRITSGSWSPTLNEAIALAYVPTEYSKVGNELLIEIREKKYPAKIIKKPFYRKG